jgi:hypothetical protein
MLFSETEGIGLDELLSYVDVTIKTNIEKEKKHELLKERVNELKELFKRTPLTKLQRLKFSFDDEDLMPGLNDLTLNEPAIEEKEQIDIPQQDIAITEEHELPEPKTIEENLSDEEREILEEEKRAESYRKYQQNQKSATQLENIKKKVELPPKKIIQSETGYIIETCDCSPDEACSKCIDKKSL